MLMEKNRDSEGSEDPSEEMYLSDVNPTQSPCSLGRVVQAFWASGSLPVTSGVVTIIMLFS